jgi:hypothetical protein
MVPDRLQSQKEVRLILSSNVVDLSPTRLKLAQCTLDETRLGDRFLTDWFGPSTDWFGF